MPVRTRSSAPSTRIYCSPAAQEQVKFKPRRKLVTYRGCTGGSRKSRQSTLTQIDFVNLQHLEDNDYKEIDDEEPPKKKRRTEEKKRNSTSRYQTQTLTQLDFVSMAADDLCGNGDKNLDGANDDIKPEPNTQTGNGNINLHKVMGPPRTPRLLRTYEVPSSESPMSPASNRSRRSAQRSPLKAINQNIVSNPPRRIKEEIQDSEEEEELETWQDEFERGALVKSDLNCSDTQQAEDQLQSNILQFTQHDSAAERAEPLRPSQATTVALSQNEGQPRSSPIKPFIKSEEPQSPGVDEESETRIPESPLHQVSASPSTTLPKLRNGGQTEPSICDSDPPVPFSIGSSQLLTRSQMLPESLMQDTAPLPPLVIEDSDFDE